jgi:hypothetical protein
MATTTQETHNTFKSLIQKMTTIAAGLLQITDEQRDLIYRIEAITTATYEMPALHPDPQLVIDEQQVTLMPALHLDLQRIGDKQQPTSMDRLPAPHPGLQWISDEQQPMSMDVLPVLHPDRQQVVNEQQFTLMPAPQPAVPLELLPPPALILPAPSTPTSAAVAPMSVLLELPTPSGPTAVIALTSPLATPPSTPNSVSPSCAERSRHRPGHPHQWSPTVPTRRVWRKPVARSIATPACRAQRKQGRIQPPQ